MDYNGEEISEQEWNAAERAVESIYARIESGERACKACMHHDGGYICKLLGHRGKPMKTCSWWNKPLHKDTSYWWCPECMEEVDPHNVTFQEFHDKCGCKVIAKDSTSENIIFIPKEIWDSIPDPKKDFVLSAIRGGLKEWEKITKHFPMLK
jgi:hypothetical protein